jgi:hypothetical protein
MFEKRIFVKQICHHISLLYQPYAASQTHTELLYLSKRTICTIQFQRFHFASLVSPTANFAHPNPSNTTATNLALASPLSPKHISLQANHQLLSSGKFPGSNIIISFLKIASRLEHSIPLSTDTSPLDPLEPLWIVSAQQSRSLTLALSFNKQDLGITIFISHPDIEIYLAFAAHVLLCAIFRYCFLYLRKKS